MLNAPSERHLRELSIHVLLAGRQECLPILQPACPQHRARRSQIEGRSDKESCIGGVSEVMLGEQRNILGYNLRGCLIS
jgi:hypothetical protein